VVASRLVENPRQLRAAGDACGWPVVLKTAQPEITHKSEQNGVVTGLADQAQLHAAYQALCAKLGARALVMPMVAAGVEVSLGMKNDAHYGPMVIVACGGVLIELLAERAFRLAPVDRRQAASMIDELRLARLLAGIRGQPAVDREALVDLIVRFSALVLEFRDMIAEMDLNPVIVNQDGATIVDALVIAKHAASEQTI
jgi:acyl-CoA synthetase (NDP forming)